MFIEFNVNVGVEVDRPKNNRGDRPLESHELRSGDVSRIRERDTLTASIPGADTAHEMIEAITRGAFPSLHAALSKRGEILPEATVRAAIAEELDVLVRASWRQQQTKRRPDETSQVAAAMGTSPRLIEYWREHAMQERPEPKPPRKPKRPTKKKPRRK